MHKLLHIVGDLPASQRSAVEAIIGHALRDDQQLYIVALDAAVEPSKATRRQAWSELEEIMAESHQNFRKSGVSQEELERTIDETCDEVRQRRNQ